jgi:hypothetical protein
MKLQVTQTDLTIGLSAVGSIVKAGTAKEKDMKPNSTDFKVLAVNRSLLEKLQYKSQLMEKEKLLLTELEFNRQEAKVFIASMLMVSQLQAKSLEEYHKRPDDHPSFSSEEGRTRKDYIDRLNKRIEETGKLLDKMRRAL